MRTKVLKALAGFSAALLAIGMFTWLVGWDEIVFTVSRASLPLLLLGGVVAFVGFLAVGVAWWIVVKEVTDYSMAEGLWVFLATQFANSVTPLGQFGGEPFIAYILARDSDISIEESFGAVLAADIMNTVPFFTLSFLGIFIFLIYFPLGDTVSFILKAVIGLSILVFGGFLALWRYKEETLELLERLGYWMASGLERLELENGAATEMDGEYLKGKGEGFYAVFEELIQARETVVRALVASHIAGLLGVAAMWLLIYSFGVNAPTSAILFVLPASMLAGYLPLPGGLGGIEVAMALLLNTVVGVPLPLASAAALFYRLFTYWIGMMFLGGVAASRLSVEIFSG